MSITIKNLESALAGESMAHIKYRYFAKIAREEGFEDIAKHFWHTADQELLHAWGHLELLIGKPSTKECLEKAIEGETYEFTTMYPEFETIANREGELHAGHLAHLPEHRQQHEQPARRGARAQRHQRLFDGESGARARRRPPRARGAREAEETRLTDH